VPSSNTCGPLGSDMLLGLAEACGGLRRLAEEDWNGQGE
jgi:hypothetical protein